MNTLKNIFAIWLVLLLAVSCEKEFDNLEKIDQVAAPTNLTASFDIVPDNSGLVTIIPQAIGVTEFMIKFGDTLGETPTKYGLNQKISHIYGEGVYTVELTAMSLNGLTTTLSQELTVSFKAPENLTVTIQPDDINPRFISVSATADFATVMDIYFGDTIDEVPQTVLPGEAASNLYEEPGDYEIKVIAKSAGTATSEYTEIITVSAASDPVNLPIDFESFTVNYAFVNFDGAESSVIENPDPNGTNTSARVAQTMKTTGAATWAGSILTLENPIDFSSKKLFKMKVWSPKTDAIVKLKVENLTTGDIAYEVDATTTTSNEWEELQFDFTGIDISNEYQKIVIFFDFGNPGDDALYYFDDVKLLAGNLPQVLPVEDFEGEAPTFTTFGNIADIEMLTNPDQSGINTTLTSAKLTKTEGSETWAGAFFEPSQVLDLVNYSKIRVATWSPKSGIIIKMKLENIDASVTHEVDIVNSTANAWEELVYDFSGAPAADYVKLVLFFDFDVAGDGSEYYFDEIQLKSEGGVAPSVSFEDFEGVPPEFTSFGNASAQVIANPDPSGVNTTANVAEFIKPSNGETWAGTYFDLGYGLDIVTYPKLSVKTWSPKTGAVVRLKLENSANSDEFFEVDLNTSVSDSWEELVYDLSAAPAYNYDRVVIFFDFGNVGDDTTYYFDEFVLTI